TRRRLRRPPIQLEVVRCRRSLWRRFERHHYLSGQLASGASCYAAIWNDSAVTLPQPENTGARRDAETQRDPESSSSLRLRVSAREEDARRKIRIAYDHREPVAFCATCGLY